MNELVLKRKVFFNAKIFQGMEIFVWMAALGWQKVVLHEVSRVMSGACYVGLQHDDGCVG